MSVAANIASIRARIAAAAARAGREANSVTLVAVGKTFPANRIAEAIEAGQAVFGENYVQEAAAKIPELRRLYPERNLEFHFIGHLQRNKVRLAVEHFDVIQTVDRPELAKEIEKEAGKAGKKMNVLLQVNVSEEESKGGSSREGLLRLAEVVELLPHLELGGLMCIGSAPEEAGEGRVRSEYLRMGTLRAELSEKLGRTLPELSMGMSADFELALEYGATIVRVGSLIFGQRGSEAPELEVE